MTNVPVPAYQQFWTDKRSSLKNEHTDLVSRYPNAAATIKQLFKVLCDLEDVASYTPVGWAERVRRHNQLGREQRKLLQGLQGKTLFRAPYGTYTVTLNELKRVRKASSQQGEGFKEVHNRKRHSRQEATNTPKNTTLPAPSVNGAKTTNFAPLRTVNMDTDPLPESNPAAEEAVPETCNFCNKPHPVAETSEMCSQASLRVP
jgi:hypothetical protein